MDQLQPYHWRLHHLIFPGHLGDGRGDKDVVRCTGGDRGRRGTDSVCAPDLGKEVEDQGWAVEVQHDLDGALVYMRETALNSISFEHLRVLVFMAISGLISLLAGLSRLLKSVQAHREVQSSSSHTQRFRKCFPTLPSKACESSQASLESFRSSCMR